LKSLQSLGENNLGKEYIEEVWWEFKVIYGAYLRKFWVLIWNLLKRFF
jgi:hypothetical protein